MFNYWEKDLFPQFLNTIVSITLSELSNYNIQSELNNLAKRAISTFKFPSVKLTYEFDDTIDPCSGIAKGYYFTENVGQRELTVLVARMKQFWIEYQISQERMFFNAYYDRDVRLHSPGNTIDKLIKMLTTFKSLADEAEYNYGRVSVEGRPTLGEINE
jgi:hypothetical protein